MLKEITVIALVAMPFFIVSVATLTPCPKPLDKAKIQRTWITDMEKKGKKGLHYIMTSKANYNTLTQILTGKDAVENTGTVSCLHTTEAADGFALYGFPTGENYTRADYKCKKDVCEPTGKSKNQKLAAMYAKGKPFVVLTDNASWTVDFRCAKGAEPIWYVKHKKHAIEPEHMKTITDYLTSQKIDASTAVTTIFDGCPPFHAAD